MSDLRRSLEDALGPLYRIEREVRPVGDCRMFVALERPAGPELLVKLLPAELSLAVDFARFERELVLLRDQLGHPRVVAPRGAGRAGALVFHTRAFIEGTTLRAWLQRHGQLPLRQAVEVLRDVLEALSHAHAAGLAHGDLKPENVLLTDGRASVADAGIVGAVGRALAGGSGKGGAQGPGAATVALCARDYVAPERRSNAAAGAGPRDDMFALGVLAHEMLTGALPAATPESIEEVRAVPPWLAELVRRCRADATARWPDAAAALESLSWGREEDA